MARKRNISEVLRYSTVGASRQTVRRAYLRWRKQQKPPLPERCDNPECFFHTNPLIWNARPFKPILDHVQGVNRDNRPTMLRLLCPNCDSQLATRGGGNKGRVEMSEGGFAQVSNGKRQYTLIAESGDFGPAPAKNKELDTRELKIDNNVVVGGGIIAAEGMAWPVPAGASHVIGSKSTSMKLVADNPAALDQTES